MKKVYKIVLVLSCVTTLFFVGCHKKETVEVDNETQSSVDNAVADQEYMSIVPATNGHAINTKGTGANNGKLSMPNPCDTLHWLNRTSSYNAGNTTYPIADTNLVNNKYVSAPIYELNLLPAACPSAFTDGKIRTGKWIIRITGPLKLVGSQMILKLVNHKASGITYSCDSMVVTTTATTAISSSFNIKLINGVCSSPNWTIKYRFDRTFTNYAKGNPVGTDPFVEVFGTANGVNRVGKAFEVNIPQASPLIKHKNCQYIDKGILELTPEGFKTRTVDFGNGTCDDDATFTVNGSTVAFKLK
ncbi:MAG: hypothetical protein Q8L81_14700 [Bacteroidota bacterium]|nr:hypothetical protein [Bacteroidota bacterium]